MAMIKIEHLTFSYPCSVSPVFEDVNIQFDTDWKLGVIGRNGKGKTTLMKLLLDEYPYSGNIIKNTTFDYFPARIKDHTQCSVNIIQTICPYCEEWEMVREFSYLDLSADILQREFHTLSGGEQTKVLLVALFLNNNRFLLIDEPTNHLDKEAREQVAAYLKRKKGFLLISHDRNFLDACVDHILSFQRNTIEIQSGNYSVWSYQFQKQQERETIQNEQLKREIKQMSRAAQRNSTWSHHCEASKFNNGPVDRGFIGHKSAKMMKRAKTIEAHKEQAIAEKAKLLKNMETIDNLKLSMLRHHAKTLLTLDHYQTIYHDQPIHQPLSFCVNQGECIVLDGKNGCGKSSLMKLISGNEINYCGNFSKVNHLQLSYVGQDCSLLNGLLKDFITYYHINESLFKAILRKLDFDRMQFSQDMHTYSDGQKKKVMIAKSLCESAHLYLWDEPLNFIDMFTRIQIEKLLKESNLTMILVEHDRYFQEAVADKLIEMKKL